MRIIFEEMYFYHVSCLNLAGIEYIVSERLFESLDPEEQKLWHSHDYEVTFYFYNL